MQYWYPSHRFEHESSRPGFRLCRVDLEMPKRVSTKSQNSPAVMVVYCWQDEVACGYIGAAAEEGAAVGATVDAALGFTVGAALVVATGAAVWVLVGTTEGAVVWVATAGAVVVGSGAALEELELEPELELELPESLLPEED